MAERCVHHPGRESIAVIAGNAFCEQCRDGQEAAALRVDRHVVPADCFVIYVGHDEWSPQYGTGCAHWVAHQIDVQAGRPGVRCLRGYTLRVRDLIRPLRHVSQLARIREGDVYVTPGHDHCGLVTQVIPDRRTGAPRVWIQHDSVKQRGLVTDEFATHFGGRGEFYRLR